MGRVSPEPAPSARTPRLGPDSGRPLTYADVAGYEHPFWSRAHVVTASACWPWEGRTNPTGYGVWSSGRLRRPLLAHRVAYVFGRDDIPAGLTVDHLCQNKRCVNPDHLQLVTSSENRALVDVRGGSTPNRCRHGHEAVAYRSTDGRRYCRECNRLAWHKRKAA